MSLVSSQQRSVLFPRVFTGQDCKRPTPAKRPMLPRPDARFDIPTSSEALDHGLKALLTYQALPRLREIRLELENFEDQVEAELRPKIALLREQYALVNRLDDRGNVVHVELQPPGKERIWSGAVTDDEERLLELSRGSVRKRRIVEIVWKVEKVKEEHEGEGQVEVDVPGLEFSDADRGPLGSANVEIKRQWEEKWDQEGSLLKFVE